MIIAHDIYRELLKKYIAQVAAEQGDEMGDTYCYRYLLKKYIAHFAVELTDEYAFRYDSNRHDMGDLEFDNEDKYRLEDLFLKK